MKHLENIVAIISDTIMYISSIYDVTGFDAELVIFSKKDNVTWEIAPLFLRPETAGAMRIENVTVEISIKQEDTLFLCLGKNNKIVATIEIKDDNESLEKIAFTILSFMFTSFKITDFSQRFIPFVLATNAKVCDNITKILITNNGTTNSVTSYVKKSVILFGYNTNNEAYVEIIFKDNGNTIDVGFYRVYLVSTDRKIVSSSGIEYTTYSKNMMRLAKEFVYQNSICEGMKRGFCQFEVDDLVAEMSRFITEAK